MSDADLLFKVLGGAGGLSGMAALYVGWQNRHAPARAIEHTNYEEAMALATNCQKEVAEIKAELKALRESTDGKIERTVSECESWKNQYWAVKTEYEVARGNWERERVAVAAAHRLELESMATAHRLDMEAMRGRLSGMEARMYEFTTRQMIAADDREMAQNVRDTSQAARETSQAARETSQAARETAQNERERLQEEP